MQDIKKNRTNLKLAKEKEDCEKVNVCFLSY
jgi:hypothetical protein